MPGGSEDLKSLAWQPLPGAPAAQIYPLIRKLDTVSSNSYLIAAPEALILIDPGGLPEQVNQFAEIIAECRREKDRPVFVFLTHAHVDHFCGIFSASAFAFPETAVFAVQEAGAVSLESCDTRLTQSDLFFKVLSPMKIGLHLFPDSWEKDCGIPITNVFPNGAAVTITYTRHAGLPAAWISFGSGPALDLWHTPGHSPDSICIRMGSLLFIGDLLFAASPGVAGLCGWDQKDLVRTLGHLGDIIGAGISAVCPGHGRIMTVPDTLRMLSAVQADAQPLGGIAEFDNDRADLTAAFAEDCMEQVNELFTIMAGRLYYVSYVMEELGEAGVADRMSSLIPADTIDELLDAFSQFAEEHHRKGTPPVYLALKAGQVTGRLERAFKGEDLARIIDPSFVDRSGRLLSDYAIMLRGFNPPADVSGQDIVPLIEAAVTGLSVSSCSDEDLLSSADDDDAFTGILLSRIGTRPLLEDVAFSLDTGGGSAMALVDPAHFTDLLTYLLEDLVGTGSDRIVITVLREGKECRIPVSGTRASSDPVPAKKMRFLSGLSRRAGGNLSCSDAIEERTYTITLAVP